MKKFLLILLTINLLKIPAAIAAGADYPYTKMCLSREDGIEFRGSHGRTGTSFYEEYSKRERTEPLGLPDAYIYEVDLALQKKYEAACNTITADEQGVKNLSALIADIATECNNKCYQVGNSHTRQRFFADFPSQTMNRRQGDQFINKCKQLCDTDNRNLQEPFKIFASTVRAGARQCNLQTLANNSRRSNTRSVGGR